MTNKLSHIFECSDHITEKQYRTSRALFILDGCASTQIFTVTSGAFLSGLAYLVGAGTALTGIIAALPTLMNTIQIFSSVVYENRAGSKRITVEFALMPAHDAVCSDIDVRSENLGGSDRGAVFLCTFLWGIYQHRGK